MNSVKLYFPFVLCALAAMPVCADVMYQCVDDSGHKTFSNIKSPSKGAKCSPMDLGPATSVPAAKAAGGEAACQRRGPLLEIGGGVADDRRLAGGA